MVRCGLLLLCLILLNGCLWRTAGNDQDELPAQAYIDAVRQFAIEYPAHWQLEKTTPTSVIWAGDSARATVTTMPGGMEEALNWLQLAHPALVIATGEKIPLTNGQAQRFLEHSANGVCLIYLLADDGRASIIEFTTAPENFEALRPIFQQMAESFNFLEQ